MSPRRSTAGQPPSGGGHGGVTHRACAASPGTGASCRPTRSCSPDQIPVTVAQPSTEPSPAKRPATASKSAPATWTAPFHTALTRRSKPPGSAIGSAGWNQSPRSFRTRQPVAAARSPSRTTSPSTSVWPRNHAEPGAGSGVHNAHSRAARTSSFCTRVTTHIGGSARAYEIVGRLHSVRSGSPTCRFPADYVRLPQEGYSTGPARRRSSSVRPSGRMARSHREYDRA